MLKLKNVSKFYYNKGMIATGFTKINLELKMGEFIAITGESGSGKSTLLNVISGLDSYEEGEMYINGKETSHYTEKDFEEYRRKYIANIFQSFNLINSYTVYQNVELVLLLNGYKKRQVKKKILEIIDQVGLTKFKNTKVSKLSGGQKQRVAIARAMVKDTPIIVADEPTGNLDTESAKEVIEILKRVAKNKLVVLVTHNIEQIEEYATRIIKMHDGRIIENTQIKEVKEEPKVEESKYNKITIFNKYRLGIRNTFNILTKFLLLFAVFFFITASIFLEYGSFKLSEYMNSEHIYDENRILIKKQDKTAFNQEDYEKIKNISNVDYIVEDDLIIDKHMAADRQIGARDMMAIGGYISNIKNFSGNLDIGRMPERENEIVIEIGREHYYVTNILNELVNQTFTMWANDYYRVEEQQEVVVVGIKYTEDKNKIYVHNSILEKMKISIHKGYCDTKVLFNNKYINAEICPSDKVEKGQAIVNDELRYQIENRTIKNKPINIKISNIYYSDELNLKISDTFTEENYVDIVGNKNANYYVYKDTIFINREEYNAIYDKPLYQSSVYVKDIEEIDTTLKELENIEIKAKKITDYKTGYESDNLYRQILKIIKLIVTIILTFVLFFISYFIIRIILKSRNIYYTTLRILGATYKSVKRILDIELFVNSSLAYIGVIIPIILSKMDIINLGYISRAVRYVSIKECILMYLILIVMSRLISRKFTKKLFKNTTINTYNEEV